MQYICYEYCYDSSCVASDSWGVGGVFCNLFYCNVFFGIINLPTCAYSQGSCWATKDWRLQYGDACKLLYDNDYYMAGKQPEKVMGAKLVLGYCKGSILFCSIQYQYGSSLVCKHLPLMLGYPIVGDLCAEVAVKLWCQRADPLSFSFIGGLLVILLQSSFAPLQYASGWGFPFLNILACLG